VQVADSAAGLSDCFTLDLQDQPQHAMGGRVLRTHVHDDAFTGIPTAGGLDDLLPVLTDDSDDSLSAAVLIG
jgi:hypothetical protein